MEKCYTPDYSPARLNQFVFDETKKRLTFETKSGLMFINSRKLCLKKFYPKMTIDQIFFKGYSYRIEKLINISYALSRSNVEFGLDCINNIREEFEKSEYLLKSAQSKMIKHCLYRIKHRLRFPKTRYDKADIWIFTSQLDALIKEAFLENGNS